jgi:RimJ/RimL family protein N-acetyltransferase
LRRNCVGLRADAHAARAKGHIREACTAWNTRSIDPLALAVRPDDTCRKKSVPHAARLPSPLRLVRVDKAHKLALQTGRTQLQALLGAALPDGWPQFPEAFDPAYEQPAAWPAYFFVSPAEGMLVGNGGFAGTPTDNGEIEIGYEIAPVLRNRGFATAAVHLLMQEAFALEDIHAVVAQTLAEENASNAVLKKAGFVFDAEVPNEEVGTVWRWRRGRA